MRSFFAAVIGVIICAATIYPLEMLGMKLFPMKVKIDPHNITQLRNMMHLFPTPALIFIILSHFMGMIFGAFAASRIQPKTTTPLLLIFLLVLIVNISKLASISHPVWFMVADIAAITISGFLSWRYFYNGKL